MDIQLVGLEIETFSLCIVMAHHTSFATVLLFQHIDVIYIMKSSVEWTKWRIISHICMVGHQLKFECSLDFDWVLLISGPGHIEMNMLKTEVELVWDILWLDLVQLMQFKSENALKALKAAQRISDHHKGWQLAVVARDSLYKELDGSIRERATRDRKPKCACNKFPEMYHVGTKCNIHLYKWCCFWMFGFHVYVQARHQRWSTSIGRVWTWQVFKVLVCPKSLHRELEISYNIILARLPDNERPYSCEVTYSMHLTGIEGTAEGPEFRLKVNRRIQQWLPKCPYGTDWEIALWSAGPALQAERRYVLRHWFEWSKYWTAQEIFHGERNKGIPYTDKVKIISIPSKDSCWNCTFIKWYGVGHRVEEHGPQSERKPS